LAPRPIHLPTPTIYFRLGYRHTYKIATNYFRHWDLDFPDSAINFRIEERHQLRLNRKSIPDFLYTTRQQPKIYRTSRYRLNLLPVGARLEHWILIQLNRKSTPDFYLYRKQTATYYFYSTGSWTFTFCRTGSTARHG